MPGQIASPPLQDSIVELDDHDPQRRRPFYMSKALAIWLQQSVLPRVEASAQVLTVVRRLVQAASIPVTPLPLTTLAGGLYRVSWYLRVTQAGGASGSIQFTLNWLESGIALGRTGPVEAGNTTGTTQSGEWLIEADANAPISYSTTYASAGAPAMQYRLTVLIELVF